MGIEVLCMCLSYFGQAKDVKGWAYICSCLIQCLWHLSVDCLLLAASVVDLGVWSSTWFKASAGHKEKSLDRLNIDIPL